MATSYTDMINVTVPALTTGHNTKGTTSTWDLAEGSRLSVMIKKQRYVDAATVPSLSMKIINLSKPTRNANRNMFLSYRLAAQCIAVQKLCPHMATSMYVS